MLDGVIEEVGVIDADAVFDGVFDGVFVGVCVLDSLFEAVTDDV